MSPDDAHPDPVFWWWEDEVGSHVVLLTDTVFRLSGPLEKQQLSALERARQAGNVLDGDFGTGAVTLELCDLVQVRYIQRQRRVLLFMRSGDSCSIQPAKASAGVASGLFDTMVQRFPGSEILGAPKKSGNSRHPNLSIYALVALAVVGLICLGLAGRIGYLPAVGVFAALAALQTWRVITAPPPVPTDNHGTQILDLRGTPAAPRVDSAAMALEPPVRQPTPEPAQGEPAFEVLVVAPAMSSAVEPPATEEPEPVAQQGAEQRRPEGMSYPEAPRPAWASES